MADTCYIKTVVRTLNLLKTNLFFHSPGYYNPVILQGFFPQSLLIHVYGMLHFVPALSETANNKMKMIIYLLM